MFLKLSNKIYRPALKNIAEKIPDTHTLAQSLIKSQSGQRLFFKFQQRNTQKRDLAKEFQSISKHSAKQETSQAKIDQSSSHDGQKADPQTHKTTDQLIKERNQNLKRQSNQAFQQQSKRLDQEFQEQRKKQHVGIFDVFSDIKSGVGSSFKKSGEYISELKSKASEKLSKKQQKQEQMKQQQKEQKEQKENINEENKVQQQTQQAQRNTTQHTEKKPVQQQQQEPLKSFQKPIQEQGKQQRGPKKIRPQRGQSIADKISGYGTKFSIKVQKQAPSLYKVCAKYGGHIQDCWDVTFPNKQKMARRKIQEKKIQAEKALTPQEIQKIQLDIPEFKRHALVISQQKDPVKRRSLVRKLRQNVRERVRKTELYQQIRKGQNYKKYEEFKQDLAEFKQNLRDQIDSSPNKFVAIGRQVYDRATSQSKIGSAILKMRKLNPSFEFQQLIFEIPEIVHPLYSQYLDGNIQFIEKCCEQQALAYLKSRVKARRNKKMVPKFNVPLFVDQAYFLGGKIGQNNLPQFIYSLRIQEIGCLVDIKDQNKIVQGNQDLILGSHFRLTVQPHDSPDLMLTGHNWKFVQFEKIAEVEQLV